MHLPLRVFPYYDPSLGINARKLLDFPRSVAPTARGQTSGHPPSGIHQRASTRGHYPPWQVKRPPVGPGSPGDRLAPPSDVQQVSEEPPKFFHRLGGRWPPRAVNGSPDLSRPGDGERPGCPDSPGPAPTRRGPPWPCDRRHRRNWRAWGRCGRWPPHASGGFRSGSGD